MQNVLQNWDGYMAVRHAGVLTSMPFQHINHSLSAFTQHQGNRMTFPAPEM